MSSSIFIVSISKSEKSVLRTVIILNQAHDSLHLPTYIFPQTNTDDLLKWAIVQKFIAYMWLQQKVYHKVRYKQSRQQYFTINRATPTFSNTYFLQINYNHKDMSSLEYIIKTHFLHVDSNNKLIKRYDLDNEGEGYLAISDFEMILAMNR